MADLLTERLQSKRKPMRFLPPTEPKPDPAAKPRFDGFKYEGPAGYDNKKRFQEMDPVAFMSYRDTVEPYYKNYPGGFEGRRKEALAYRKKNNNNNFDKTSSVALAPRLQDDWVMDRKNPVYLNAHHHTKDRPDGRGGVVMGNAWIDAMRDADGRKYSPSDMYPRGVSRWNPGNHEDMKGMLKGQIKRGLSPWHGLVEENTHGAQPAGGVNFRDKEGYFGEPGSVMPYAARNVELGAKLTNEKHKYIRNRWSGEKNDRKDSFKESDAADILKTLYEGKYSPDWGLKNFIQTEKGRKYLKENKDELIQFLMSTAQADPKPQPGMFTGQSPMVEGYA